ncbi:MAG: hypothetical protein K9N23_18965 [Akkermansiaceae bacterium]|nr:hypothetical protein [Akkermansiaceae bacterium]
MPLTRLWRSVRAGMVEDPALYRWSSYGEAMGSGAKGNGAKARGGLVRAIMAHRGCAADEWGAQDAGCWSGGGGSDLECAGFEGGVWGKLKLESSKLKCAGACWRGGQ